MYEQVSNSGPSATKTSYRVYNLTNGIGYDFRIRAWTRDDAAGPISDDITSIPMAAPSAPMRLRATPGIASAELQWELPTDNTITEWQHRYKTTSSYGPWTTFSTNAATRSRIVRNLTNDTEYTFQVRANTTSGDTKIYGDNSNEWSATPSATVTLFSGTLTAGTGADKLYPDWPTARIIPTRAIRDSRTPTQEIQGVTAVSATPSLSTVTTTTRSVPSATPVHT